jgi:hypothetical protein
MISKIDFVKCSNKNYYIESGLKNPIQNRAKHKTNENEN